MRSFACRRWNASAHDRAQERMRGSAMGEVNLVNVSKHFMLRIEGKAHAVKALDRVSFSVRDGEIVVLIGPSGCGKTTALRVAMGLESASGGKVTVDGSE